MADPRRILALALPRFATERLVRREPTLAGQPLVLWASEGPARLVAAASPGAGVAPGMPLADALAASPRLVCRAADIAGQAATLRTLALWAQRFTPLSAPDAPDGLLLDITGAAHLAGGEAALMADALIRLAGLGFSAQGAVAGTSGAAASLARARPGTILPAGGERAAIRPLPLAAFRLDATVIEAAARFGLRTAGDVLDQPRAPLARRLGPGLLAVLDRATGDAPWPIRPLRPPAAIQAALDCIEPILTAEAIGIGIGRLTEQLCARLTEQGLGARRLTLTCTRTDATTQRIGIGTGVPSRDPGHLAGLLAGRIEQIDPGFGIERLVLAADATEPLGAAQMGMGADRSALSALLDRLEGRLGAGRVHRLAPYPSHWPEEAARPVGPHDPVRAAPAGWAALPRPLRLFRWPRPVSVTADAAGAPLRLGPEAIRHAEGPERLARAWWKPEGGGETRDYWRVETARGQRLWLFRRDRDWFVHGPFA